MAIEDYLPSLPNIFGGVPVGFEGLLGTDQAGLDRTAALQKRANIGGLLASVGALAQGMSSEGARRSPLQNIVTALGAGYGAAGQTYESGLRNILAQQQFQTNLLTQQQAQARQAAIGSFLKNDPALATLLQIDPAEGVKQLALRQQMQQLRRPPTTVPSQVVAPAQVTTPEPAAPAGLMASDGGGFLGGGYGSVGVAPPAQPAPVQAPPAQAAPAPVSTVPSAMDALLAKRAEIEKDIDFLRAPERALIPNADKALKAAQDEYERLTKQISFESTANRVVDIQKMRDASPVLFKNDFDFLEAAARDKTLTPEQLVTRTNDLNKRIQEYQKDEKAYERKLNDFTNEAVRIGRKVIPGKDPKDYNDRDYALINDQMQKEAIARRPATTINLSDPTRKAQALAENSAKYMANKSVSESFEVATRFNNFVQAYNNPEAAGASDAVLIYSMAKMLDPGGAVQQGDIGTIAGQKSIPDKLKSFHQSLINSRTLSDAQREDLNAMAYSLMNVKRKSLEPVTKQYRNYATALQSPDSTADVQNPFDNVTLPKERVVTINQKRVKVRLGLNKETGEQGYFYTAPNGKTYPYQD